MHTLGTHFEKLIQNLSPAQERRDAARDLPEVVRNYLRTSQDFATVDPHTHLVGSYAQDLSVGDVKDVDILVRVDGDPTTNNPEAKKVIRSLGAALRELPEWDELPLWLGLGGNVDVTGSRRSVHIFFEGHAFHLDIVPCIAPDGFSAELWVPDRGWNSWVRSHPVGIVQLITMLNDRHGGKVRPLGKLLKHFRNHQMQYRRPKSYWLVALLLHQVQEGRLDFDQPLALVFRDLLEEIYNKYAPLLSRNDQATPNIADPLLDHNVSWNWDRSDFEAFMNRLANGTDWATSALAAHDRDEAIKWWQKIFGASYFPSDVSSYARTLTAASYPGAAHAAGTGLILPSRPDSGVSTPIKRTTFHGESLK